MRRYIFGFLAIFGSVVALAGALGVSGYYIHKLRIEPAYSLLERIELKLRREMGFQTDTEMAVERIDTIFATLRGNVHVMPDRDFINGGAVTVWGEHLLVMHRSGKVFWLDQDQEEGMVLSDLVVPDNGAAGYAQLVAEKFAGRNARADALRYNDIEYIETATDRGLLLSYTFVNVAEECYSTRVSWLPFGDETDTILDVSAITVDDWELLFETSPCLAFNPTNEVMVAYMAGGRMTFEGPDTVYLASGEYHLDGIYRPDVGIQSPDSDYGKTLAISLSTGESRHISVGHRNLQGMTLDLEGRLWTTEHGMRGGDELNLIKQDENYGWPIEDMGTLYNGIAQNRTSGPGRHTEFTAPVYAWVPSAAVSSLAVVDGFHPAWDGDLLIGSLKERTLFRARIQGERLVSLEPIPIGQRIRDVTQWGPDRIALWLDLNEVVVLEVEPRVDPLDGMVEKLVADDIPVARAQVAVETLGSCAECHAYAADVHQAGPSLAGVVGRAVAGTAFNGYSDALRSTGGNWTQDRLTQYLTDPAAFVEGTSMTGLGVSDPQRAADLVSALDKIEVIQSLD